MFSNRHYVESCHFIAFRLASLFMENFFKSQLDPINGDRLKAMAKNLGVFEKTHTKKSDFINSIERFMRLHPNEFIQTLSEPEKKLLSEIVYSGKVPGFFQFQAKYGQPFPSLNIYSSDRTLSLLVCFISHEDEHFSKPLISPELAAAYKSLLPPPAEIRAKVLTEPPETYDERPVQVFSGERHIAAELCRVLRLVHAGKIKVTESSRRPTDSGTRILSGALLQPDFALEPPKAEIDRYTETAGAVRAHAWGVLVQQCGWAKPRVGCLNLTASGQDILSAFTPGKFRDGVNLFLKDNAFDELHRVNHIRGQTGNAKRWISPAGERRTSFEDHLDAWPVGEWLHFDEAYRLIQAAGGSLDIFESDRGMLYIGDAQYGTIYDETELSRQFLRVLLMESLATLGLVDIAWVYPHELWPEFEDCYGRDAHSFVGRYDGLQAVRLNALGAYCFGINETYDFVPAEEAKKFHLLANHELTAIDTPDVADLAFLELIAKQKNERVWQLDQTTILLSMEQGTRPSDIRDFLSNSSRQGIPANIDKWLEDLFEKAFACRKSERAVLLEWRDPVQALLVANSSGTGKLCQHAGENRIVVADRHLAAFSREARKMGFIIPCSKK